jgi:uncharacterized membrane protein
MIVLPIEQLHPIAVHFPIVFLLSLAALDLFAVARKIPIDGRGGVANLSAGLAVLAGLGATAAYAFGDAALDIALAKGVAEAQLETHAMLGTITAALLALWGLARAFAWWRDLPIGGARAWCVVVVEIAFSLLIIAAAYFGGQLVYELGVNVNFPPG